MIVALAMIIASADALALNVSPLLNSSVDLGGRCGGGHTSFNLAANFDEELNRVDLAKLNFRFTRLSRQLNLQSLSQQLDNGTVALVKRDVPSVTIPVHLHKICSPNKAVYCPDDSKLQDQVNVLNQYYSPIGFRFSIDSSTLTYSDEWFNIQATLPSDQQSQPQQQMMNSLYIGDKTHLNMYITQFKLETPLGINSMFPADLQGKLSQSRLDGVVIDGRSLPGSVNAVNQYGVNITNEGYKPLYANGRTAVHEVGHWLGLQHTFAPGCSGSDFDEQYGIQDDTPQDSYPGDKAPKTYFTCTGHLTCNFSSAPINNFMSYSDDACMSEFTDGQKQLMQVNWKLYRAESMSMQQYRQQIQQKQQAQDKARQEQQEKAQQEQERARQEQERARQDQDKARQDQQNQSNNGGNSGQSGNQSNNSGNSGQSQNQQGNGSNNGQSSNNNAQQQGNQGSSSGSTVQTKNNSAPPQGTAASTQIDTKQTTPKSLSDNTGQTKPGLSVTNPSGYKWCVSMGIQNCDAWGQ